MLTCVFRLGKLTNSEGSVVESDIRYYQRRAREEMIAADRAVTAAARNRRLQLVDMFVQRLEQLDCPSTKSIPINQRELAS